MKKLLVTAILVASLIGCSTIPPSQTDLIQQLEQFVTDEATAYFNGTLTEQQLIDAAKSKFSALALSEIMAVIEMVLIKPAVIDTHTAGIALTKRPLVLPEKSEIQKTAFDTGVAFVRTNGTDPTHAKSLLARRLGYHYRVYPSKIKPMSDPAFDQGVASVTGNP